MTISDELRRYAWTPDDVITITPPKRDKDWDESKHPRVPAGSPGGGQFGEGGGGDGGEEEGAHPGEGYSKHAKLLKDGTIYTTSVADAQRALYEGRKVELDQPKKVSTLIQKLAKEAQRWQAAGQSAPLFNLCNVSVAGTNLFCAESKGIPRAEMPQMDDAQTKLFRKYLKDKGYKIQKESEYAANLRATQNELNGAKVAAVMDHLADKQDHHAKRLIISKDDYILDGHHHWAGKLGLDAADGNLTNDSKIKIARVNIPITKLLEEAEIFTGGKGKKPASESTFGKGLTRATGDVDYIQDPATGRFQGSHPHGGGEGEGGGGAGASNYGLVPGDVAKFKELKGQWAKINNDLLEHVDKPDGPETQAKMRELESICQQIHSLHADPGGPEGIGLPGGPRDVTIVGGGPGGLAASINGAAEGLDTLVVEANVVAGGQAKFSSRIENFPGFPVGVTGERLTQNMYTQAKRLGAEAKLGVRVTEMTYDPKTGLKHLTLSNGEHIDSRTVILAGGVEFRRLTFPGSEGSGVFVADGKALAKAGAGGDVCVIGGSNGAAQAALGCAQSADHVYLLARSPIVNSMSDYQIAALHNNPKVTVIENDSIAKLNRDERGNPQSMETQKGEVLPIKALGVFAGSVPDTKWVPKAIPIAPGGRVPTNTSFETALPGVYAVGDIRDGAIGRVGVAVGEGQFALRQANVFLDKQRQEVATAAKADRDKPTSTLITDLFDLDHDNPWLGQTIDGVTPLKKKTPKKSTAKSLGLTEEEVEAIYRDDEAGYVIGLTEREIEAIILEREHSRDEVERFIRCWKIKFGKSPADVVITRFTQDEVPEPESDEEEEDFVNRCVEELMTNGSGEDLSEWDEANAEDACEVQWELSQQGEEDFAGLERDWDESKHPRDEHGRFGEGGGGDDGDGVKPPVVVFHGTTASVADQIMKEGLHVTKTHHGDTEMYQGERGESVYVTTQQDRAIAYAKDRAQSESWAKYQPIEPIVFKMAVPADEWGKFHTDKLEGEGARYGKEIPPAWITGAYKLGDAGQLVAVGKTVEPEQTRAAEDVVEAYVVVFAKPPEKEG
jgi:thioredoxin reductase